MLIIILSSPNFFKDFVAFLCYNKSELEKLGTILKSIFQHHIKRED